MMHAHSLACSGENGEVRASMIISWEEETEDGDGGDHQSSSTNSTLPLLGIMKRILATPMPN